MTLWSCAGRRPATTVDGYRLGLLLGEDAHTAVTKWSVSVEENLASRVASHVRHRGLSGFGSRAGEHELESDLLDEYLQESDDDLADGGTGSEFAIDALAVATAARLGGGIIATHDPADLRLLAGQHRSVSILEI